MRILSFLLLFILNISAAAYANNLRNADYSSLKLIKTAKVINIIDPLTLQLETGEIIRLSGIDVPDYTAEDPGNYSLITVKVLNDMLQNRRVNIYQTPTSKIGRTNRMKHLLAQVQRTDDKLWVQGTLINLGLARVRTRKYTPQMADQMYAAENEARLRRAGIWNEDKHQIKSPNALTSEIGHVHIIQGKVESVAQNNGTIYINFGKDWKTDFTVVIRPEDQITFYKTKINPLNWKGKIIQVRGWLDSYNGPMLTLSHPEAIQILSSVGDELSNKD